ncbi:MAG TPA: DUF4238 domain-containing protein [Rhizomicrobium sp.]|jgi:hypothetical protein|nr:DUF4238 domain-containing protein [Rhizomicrobium sp.]
MRHHYIPIFYLSQWAGADGKICQFSRPHDRVVPNRKHPSGTGWEDDSYAMPGVPPRLQQFLEEVFLKQADQEANDALQCMLAGGGGLTARLRSGWSRFIMSLLSRTPDRVRQLRAMYADELASRMDRLNSAYDEFHANDEVPPSPEQKAADIQRENELAAGMLLQNVMDLPGVGQHLNNMRWSVFNIPNGRRTLLTSDKPVMLSRGLQYPDAYITLPISPTQLFAAANDQAILNQIQSPAPCDATQQSNLAVTRSASKYVYGDDDYQVNFVEKYLRPA